MDFVEDLVKEGILRSKVIIDAFNFVHRSEFLPNERRYMANKNEPIPIGFGQTNSQPWTVALMLELLEVQAGDAVLDVGTGSGWQAALLAYIVSHDEAGNKLESKERGYVISMEIIPDLVEMSLRNLSKYSFIEDKIVEVRYRNAQDGYKPGAPYERIIAAAAARSIPVAWKEQLKVGGRIVAPLDTSIVCIEKTGRNSFREQSFKGFRFVPFIRNDEQDPFY